ncbi:MAG: nucleotide sugar dehydrogenase [Candidatus Brocadiales bacterium]|nr:nucleotide sugar dehydrogenase [Candidatus Bathyanammoxibius amoris]
MDLVERIKSKDAKVGVIGLGYVGLPLAFEFCKAGFNVTGLDTDKEKVESLAQGKSYITYIGASQIKRASSLFSATSDFSRLSDMDCIIVCVPTPLDEHLRPNLSYVLSATKAIARCLRKEQLIVLESTTYPGTTDEQMRPILEKTGLKAGEDFYLAFSPERIDPDNKDFSLADIPKVVGGYTGKCLAAAQTLYDSIVVRTVPVSSTRVAEATKLLENIYRAVNIAHINEMKVILDKMGIDVWEVIEAAKTKPFGFQPFYPGPGLGGHCIPIDPFYLTWKAKEYDCTTHFIELAAEVIANMSNHVVEKVAWVLNRAGKPVNGSRILVLGVAYKKDVDDQSRSPALKIIQLLKEHGAEVSYNDPYVPVCRGHHHYPDIDMKSAELTEETLRKADLVLLITDHTPYDYGFIERHAQRIVDTRNVFARNGIKSDKVHKA